ncbi:hypothetical protein VIGAN_01266000 [Vigna angularis var. angularis]|uniref:Uncharacterized protein n=1 Tax=Vigna angularis var. angularis TaxID=157739 RepID=A0A0S3R2X2_PHAAN|nr:hypothetical protein VIGAN_01266000 [Vigna angularis var. angularis]
MIRFHCNSGSHVRIQNLKSLINWPRFRSLQNEVEELEELRDTRECFYEAKRIEMRKFKEIAESFVVNCRTEVESLRNRVNLLKSSFMELKSNSGNSCNSEITAAEMRRLELQAEKDNMCRIIDCNHQIKAQLQKQLQIILMTQTQDKSVTANYSST